MIILPPDEVEVRKYANFVVNTPAAIKIAELTARAVGVPPGPRFNELRKALALAYAQGYLRAWRARAKVRGDNPPPPTEAPES